MIKDLENEIWETHPIFIDYAASNLGRIKSLERDVYKEDGSFHQHRQERLIKPYFNDEDYLRFNISKNGKIVTKPLVHRFVYECFYKVIIPKGNKELQINHIDENPNNNRIENLELCTPQYNVEYSQAKRVAQYDLGGNLIKIWKSMHQAEREGGFKNAAIAACCKNKFTPKSPNIYKGFIWQYIENNEENE